MTHDLAFLRDFYWAATRSWKSGRDELEAFQLRRLRALLRHAYERVPFYRRRFEQAGFEPAQLRTLTDLARVPVTEKEELRAAGADAFDREIDRRRLVMRRTSGSTAPPFEVHRTGAEERMLSWLAHRRLHLHGVRLSDRRAVIKSPEPGMSTGADRLPLHARLGLNPRFGVDATRPHAQIVARLREVRPDVVSGWAQTLADVASVLTAEDRSTLRPRLVCPGGEVLTARARALAAEGFGAPIVDRYGADEIMQMADECPRGGRYHLIEASALFEVLDEGGAPVAPGEGGELVLTGFFSYAMPFIRYRIGDWVTAGGVGCPCGARVLTLLRLDGRTESRFVLPDGRRLHPASFDLEPLAAVSWLGKAQLRQETPDRVRLVLAPRAGRSATPAALAQLERRLAPAFAPHFALRCELVSEIAHLDGGKFRAYVPLAPDRTAAGGS